MKKVKSSLSKILFLCMATSGFVMAAEPEITSATLVGTALTIEGSDFGTKSTPAPVFHQNFKSTTQGDDYTDAGFDFLGGNNQSNTNNYVDMSAGAGISSGLGGWRFHAPQGSESFSHFGNNMPANNERVFASYYFKIVRGSGSGSSGYYQIKSIRTGDDSGNTGANEGSERYASLPKFAVVQNLADPSNVNDTDGGDPFGQWWSASSGTTNVYASGPGVAIHNGQWHYIEAYFQINTLGMANGIMQIWMDGNLYVDVSNLEIRTTTGEYLDYVQYLPGLANDLADYTWDINFSNIYADNNRARVFFGNSAALSTVTGRYVVPATAWAVGGDNITVTAENVPTGYDWIYVVNAAGEINADGYEYATTPGCSP